MSYRRSFRTSQKGTLPSPYLVRVRYMRRNHFLEENTTEEEKALKSILRECKGAVF